MKDKVVAEVTRCHPVKCLDGKTRLKPYKGYDCKWYVTHKVPYIWSECKAPQKRDGWYKDCEYFSRPFECPHHEINN